MHRQEEEGNNIFHERATILKEQGYRGFTVAGISREWENTRLTVKNKNGKIIEASGETVQEAYKKAIGQIDLLMD